MTRNNINLSIKRLLLTFFMLFGSCLFICAQRSSVKQAGRDDIIKHFIDVHNSKRGLPKARFYQIDFRDTAFYCQNAGEGIWDVTVYDEVSVVSFFGYDEYRYLDIDIKPNSFVRKGDVYYVWNNPDNGRNMELEKLLYESGRIISTDSGSEIELMEILMDELSMPCDIKATDIYFLRDNIYKYRIKVSSVALGYYVPPRIVCKKKKHKTIRVSTDELWRL